MTGTKSVPSAKKQPANGAMQRASNDSVTKSPSSTARQPAAGWC